MEVSKCLFGFVVSTTPIPMMHNLRWIWFWYVSFYVLRLIVCLILFWVYFSAVIGMNWNKYTQTYTRIQFLQRLLEHLDGIWWMIGFDWELSGRYTIVYITWFDVSWRQIWVDWIGDSIGSWTKISFSLAWFDLSTAKCLFG